MEPFQQALTELHPQDVRYYVSRQGQQFGPYTKAQLHQFIAERRLLFSDLAWTDGAWVPLAEFLKSGQTGTAAAPSTEQQSAFCDRCNQPASFATGTYYTASEFLTLLQNGLTPHQSVFLVTELSGMSKETLIVALPGQVSLTYTTGWLLCPSCAPEANTLLPKRGGNLPGGELGARASERTFRDAGTGKMLSLARAMATKAITGTAVSTKQADHYIISILPPAPDLASRVALIPRLLASAGYSKGRAEVSFAVSKSGADALTSFTNALLMNYEQTARAAGKQVDLRRSQLHDFGGNGVPRGQLVAVWFT